MGQGSYLIGGRWVKEARDFPADPVSGAKIVRLSGSSIRTENIYCEAPRATADGNRFASLRYIDHLLSPTTALMCHDLTTKWTCLIDREVTGIPVSPAWRGVVYYERGSTLMRASLDTCTTQPVMDLAPLPLCWQLMSVSADERYLIYTTLKEGSSEEYNVVRLDLRDRSWRLLLDRPEPSRCGAYFNPVSGHGMLIGRTFYEGGKRFGAAVLADGDGQGDKVVLSRVHHSCWLADSGKFAGLIEFDYDRIAHKPENPDGELYIYSTDATPPRLIPVPEHLFYHISSSRCGRYVVCESLESGLALRSVPIVIVNVETGKYRTLIGDAKCSHGGDAGRQVNAYFTADSRHVIYNADPDGVVNVFAAEIPQGFLESLL
jgi:hypothetical protein